MRQITREEFEKRGLKIKDYNLKWEKPISQSKDQISHIVVHHDMWPGATMEQIHQDHIKNRKFSGTGYNYRVRKNGLIEKGRPVGCVGAHCKENSMNYKSIGIVMEGCYTDYKGITEKHVPKEQLDAARKLIELLIETYNINPENIKRHADYASYKDCPGRYFPFVELKESIGKHEDEVSPWAKEAWEWAKKNGINDGWGAKNQVTEEQMMVFLKRYHDECR